MSSITIENFRAIRHLRLDIGQVTALVGENGCGKTSILEAIVLGSTTGDQDLSQRGVRGICWRSHLKGAGLPDVSVQMDTGPARLAVAREQFCIYSPDAEVIRGSGRGLFQTGPFGLRGEGLLSYFHLLSVARPLESVGGLLAMFDWVEHAETCIDEDGACLLRVEDRYAEEGAWVWQDEISDGLLLGLFYVVLMSSPDTPAFFAIDNFGAGMNPHLARVLAKYLVGLAKAHGKCVLLTTHNPAVLDGINLHDSEQRVFVISRDDETGETGALRILPPKPVGDRPPMRMSEAFMRGYIGGLPKI
jgi:hypothetical protein